MSTNPFDYHRGKGDSYCLYLHGKPCIIMKYRIIELLHCCSKGTINDTDMNTCHLQLPEEILDNESEIKNEFKFIINETITIKKLPEWFNIWTVKYKTKCQNCYCEGNHDEEIYIPISFEYLSCYQE
jgi:hypothetical protein